MSNATLYEIRDDLEALAALLADVGGDVTDADAEAAVDAWLRETDEAMREKLDRYAALIREFEERGKSRQAEADRLATLARADSNAAKRLKDRLLWFMADQGMDKVETPRFRVSIAGNGGKVPVVFATDYSAEHAARDGMTDFVRTSYAWDTDAIRQELENGVALPFAAMGERGRHLRVR